MSWADSRPGGGKSNPKYKTREHLAERKRRLAELERAGVGRCAEVVCVAPSRLIYPGMRLDLAHDKTGSFYLGLAHATCNRKDGARRARAKQNPPPPPPPPKPRAPRSWLR